MALQDLAFLLGRPFGPMYGLLMQARAAAYQRGLFSVHKMPVPVLSVGNLLLGGSGKTPLVQHLARLLLAQGRKPAIISRGYGGKAKGRVNVVSDGNRLLLEARMAGDEPRLLAETLPGVLVLTGRKRRFPAEAAVQMGADVLLLDDAFQHLALGRDVNLALFNAGKLAGDGRIFPGGELREPFSALKRASAFVLTAVNEQNRAQAEDFAQRLRQDFPDRPVAFAAYTAESALRLTPAGSCETLPLDAVRTQCGLFAFCGIAAPESFFATLAALSLPLKGVCALADHHPYTPAHLPALCAKAQGCGAQALITTEKDLVKLAPFASLLSLPLFTLRMQVNLDQDFTAWLMQELAAK